jgi:hypothetical protein
MLAILKIVYYAVLVMIKTKEVYMKKWILAAGAALVLVVATGFFTLSSADSDAAALGCVEYVNC